MQPTFEPTPSSPSYPCNSPPPPGFYCGPGGSWVTNGSLTIPGSLIIPSTILVDISGNLTIGGNIIFNGAQSSLLNISGCLLTLRGPSEIELDFSKGLPNPGKKTLIKQADACPSSLNALSVSTKQPNNNCKKVKTTIDSMSSRTTLSVVLTIDSSACNTKWIILGAVLGGIVVLAVIGILVAGIHLKTKRRTADRARMQS